MAEDSRNSKRPYLNPEEPGEIELQDTSGSKERAVALPHSTSGVASQLDNISAQEPWNILQIINKLPAINEASMRFAQTASNFGRGLSTLLEEAVNLEVNSGVPAPQTDKNALVPSSSNADHDNTHSSLSSSIPNEGNFSVERATSILSSTGSAMAELGQSFLSFRPIMWQGLVARIQTTWHGSADDIGWLTQMPGLAPAEDQTSKFEQLLASVCNGVHKLPDNLVYLLVPGLFSKYGPLYFVDTQKYFSQLGLTCHIAKIHSEAAVETNAAELKNYIEELYWGSGKQVAILAHSKGGVDAAAAVAMNWSSLKGKAAGLVLVQSPYGGSPIASDILREGQIADTQTRQLIEALMNKMLKGDIRALDDLTYDKRRDFLRKYPLPSDFPVVSFHTEVSIGPNVLSTMSHVAHAKLPWQALIPGTATEELIHAELPVIIPLSAVMAICAKHLEVRYNQKSDGLVVRQDAEVPGSVVVRPDRKLDHGWMVYSPARKYSNEPDAAQMCESLLTLLLEMCEK